MEPQPTPTLVQTGPEWYEAGLTYRYQMPDGPGPYPTVVMLHGRFGNEDVMWVFRKVIPRPWLVVAPRALFADQGSFSWQILEREDKWPELAEYDPAVTALERFIGVLPQLYNADPDRTYLMGFSQGAAVSFAAMLRRPRLARGVAAMVGFVPDMPEGAIDGRLAGLPVFMAAGTQDPTVPYRLSQVTRERLRAAGADLEYHEYPTGHKMPSAGMDDLRKWFHNQARFGNMG